MPIDIQQKQLHDVADVLEHGRSQEGGVHSSDRRLFMQLLVFGDCLDAAGLAPTLEEAAIPGVLYEDINDARGIGLLTFSEEADFFIDTLRPFLNSGPFGRLQPRPEYTMLGRTYAIGYETDLDDTLVERPRRRVTDPQLPWAIWYPLRRAGSFEQLSADEQRTILMEHGGIGRAFGKAGHGYDVRLACHGLDKNDNDFIVGLVGPRLHPLSIIVQRMRKTKQTSLHLEHLGPFFIGRALWQQS